MKNITMKLFIAFVLMLIAFHTNAQLKLPNYFADNMILQRDVKVKIWGWGKPQQEVTVKFVGKTHHLTVGNDSLWHIQFPKAKAGGPYVLSVASKNEEISVKQIYFGDVWFCSGQSNMSFRVDQAKEYDIEINDAEYPFIRHFGVPLHTAITSQKDVGKSLWTVANAKTIGKFSAVAWFFAKQVYKKNKVPIGIIHSSWGGTPIEAFMSAADLQAFPAAKKKIEVLSAHFIDSVEAQNKKLIEASCTPTPKGFVNIKNGYPTLVYNAMVAPFFTYTVKGVLWYQGEANSDLPVCFNYESMLTTMINSWRASWKDDKLPFLLVQLANYKQKVRVVSPLSGWAVTQEAQFKVSQSLKNVGIAITNDIGNPNDAHPTNKQDVGKRLASVAFREVYGDKKVVANGPTFNAVTIRKDTLTLTFTNIGGGLCVKNGGDLLNAFSVAGADNKFHKAIAKICGDKVIVYSNEVINPINVRYAFESNPPEVNFYNKEGFPAPPFRTDHLKN
jgi:sialate O-acetylesterase